MRTRIATGLAALAFATTLGVMAAPTAAAESVIQPTPAGSVGFCFIIPLGSAEIPICF